MSNDPATPSSPAPSHPSNVATASNTLPNISGSSPYPVVERPRNPVLDALHYKQYTNREALHERADEVQRSRQTAILQEKRQEVIFYQQLRQYGPVPSYGPGYSGYGNSHTGTKPSRYLYPSARRRPRPRQRELRVPKSRAAEQALAPEALVPIRLDVESDKHKLRDTFTWNAHETTVPLDWFAEILCEDFAIPADRQFIQSIQKSIADQLSDYHPLAHQAEDDDEFDISDDNPRSMDLSQPYTAYKDDDMRIPIRLDITVGGSNLVDQFDWDINNPENNPEHFAAHMCSDLALSSEFQTAIAHSIREQSQMYIKSLFLVGHPFDGRIIEDEDIRSSLLPTLVSAILPDDHVVGHTPMLYELSEAEIERQDKDQDREARRKRRQGRARRGVVLPDFREPLKTHRSLFVSSILPGGTDVPGSTFKRHIRGTSPTDDFYEPALSPVHITRATPRKFIESPLVGSVSPRVTRNLNHPPQHTHFNHIHGQSLVVHLRLQKLKDHLQRSERTRSLHLGQQFGIIKQKSEAFTQPAQTAVDGPPPDWLASALARLRQRYPNDRFDGLSKINAESSIQQPRIRCQDCPGKLYQPGPGKGCDNFEVHLKNRGHRERVQTRLQHEAGQNIQSIAETGTGE